MNGRIKKSESKWKDGQKKEESEYRMSWINE